MWKNVNEKKVWYIGLGKKFWAFIKENRDASITVEVSILFPIVIFAIITIIYMALYLGDVVSVRAVVQQYAVLESNYNKSETDMMSEIGNNIRSEVLISDITDIDVEKYKEKTGITIGMKVKIGFFDIFMSDKIKVTMYSENNCQYIVKSKVIIDTLSNIGS